MSKKDEPRTGQADSAADNPVSAACPTCETRIPEDAPGGICPKCALAEAASPFDDGTLPMTGPRFEPPALEKLAEAFPHLEIIELIGCGGMGAVYKARQPNLDRLVALKILPPSMAESPAFQERFSREGRLLAKLSHPNIVGVHDFGESGGFFFLLMEFVDGVNLRQAMRAGRFTPEQAMGVVPEVCEALQFAHDEGVLHRDIKPENILLDAKGRVKIADFGIAKLVGESSANDFSLTGTSMPGTPQYMAPEQIEHPEDVDHRADIFSLGVVFYEMLTGELPMGRFSAPSEKTAVDSQIDEIVFRSLEKERDRRQQSANQIKTEIEGISVEALSQMRHPGYGIPACKENPAIPSGSGRAAWLVALGMVFLIVLSFVAITERSRGLVQIAQDRTQASKQALQREIRYNAKVEELQNQIRENPVSPEAKIARKKLADLEVELEKDPIQRTTRVPTFIYTAGPILFIGLVLAAVCIAGTIMGWRSLRRIRALGLKEGRGAALFAALLWPVLLLAPLFLNFTALMLTLAPFWMGVLIPPFGLVLWAASTWFSIWWTLRWSKSPPSESEKARALAQSPPRKNPWIRRIAWLLAILLVGPMISMFVPRVSFVPGFFELVIVAAISLGFVSIIVALLRRGKSVKSETAVPSHPSHFNPWPQRVFWLIVALFILPAAFALLSTAVPIFVKSYGPRSHTIEIQRLEQVGNVVSFDIYSRLVREADVHFQFRYDGPPFDFSSQHSDSPILPGDQREWHIKGNRNDHSERISLGFPDEKRAHKAAQSIRATMSARSKSTWDADHIRLFDMTAAEGGSWRAQLDIEPGRTP